jgi:AAA15 family ATPase/GTPase
MAINRVEIKDFLVFKGEFVVDFCPGVNVIIGGNATGKTTLLKAIYHHFKGKKYGLETVKVDSEPRNIVYIPEKDILEHSKGLLTFIEQKQTGFGQVYRDVLINAQDTPTIKQSPVQKTIGSKIVDIIGGEVRWDKDEGAFYTLKTDGNRIPFANEASGYKKFGYLGLLLTSGQLESGSILLWDEPENSLNPELMSALVDILLELQRNGVQIFIVTHSEILATYFAINREKGDKAEFYSLYKDKETQHIKYDNSDRFDLLTSNSLMSEPVRMYEKELGRGLAGG